MRPLILGLLATLPGVAQVRAVDRPTTTGANRFYAGNRAPLSPNPLIKLPLTSIRPEGWLRRQLDLDRRDSFFLPETVGQHGNLVVRPEWAEVRRSDRACKPRQAGAIRARLFAFCEHVSTAPIRL